MTVKAEKLTKKFTQANGETLTVFADLNLEIEQQQRVSIMGPSGCGKSTLLSILSGLDRPTSGTVSVGQTSLFSISDRELTSFRTKNMGVVFQRFHLLPHLTALENVLLPLELQSIASPEEKAQEALAKVGLGGRLKHYPHQMSRGECQRVAIARVIVMCPKIIFADEPTGSLDAKNAKEIMSQLIKLSEEQKSSFVLVTHDTELAHLCETRYQLNDGTLHCV